MRATYFRESSSSSSSSTSFKVSLIFQNYSSYLLSLLTDALLPCFQPLRVNVPDSRLGVIWWIFMWVVLQTSVLLGLWNHSHESDFYCIQWQDRITPSYNTAFTSVSACLAKVTELWIEVTQEFSLFDDGYWKCNQVQQKLPNINEREALTRVQGVRTLSCKLKDAKSIWSSM